MESLSKLGAVPFVVERNEPTSRFGSDSLRNREAEPEFRFLKTMLHLKVWPAIRGGNCLVELLVELATSDNSGQLLIGVMEPVV